MKCGEATRFLGAVGPDREIVVIDDEGNMHPIELHSMPYGGPVVFQFADRNEFHRDDPPRTKS